MLALAFLALCEGSEIIRIEPLDPIRSEAGFVTCAMQRTNPEFIIGWFYN